MRAESAGNRNQGQLVGPNAEAAIAIGCVSAVIAALAFHRTRDLEAHAALGGFSPIQLAEIVTRPEAFAYDFPSGILNNLNSIVYNVYPLASRLGLSVNAVWAALIWLEIAALAIASMYAVRKLAPGAGWTTAALTAITFTAGSFLSPDMANFSFPYYGWVYAFAHAGFLIAAAAVIGRRLSLAAVMVSATFMVHPIIGSFTGIFAGAVLLVQAWDRAPPPKRALINGAVIVLLGCGAWMAWIASRSTVTSGSLDAETFIALNRAQNYHWFPSFLGFYWEDVNRSTIPLLCSLSLIAWAWDRAQPIVSRRTARQIGVGVAALMAVCCAGLIVAEYVSSPALIKLALHRADRNALIAGGLLVLPALYRDIVEGDLIEASLAVALIATPFLSLSGLEPTAVGLRVVYAAIKGRVVGESLTTGLTLALAFLALIGVLAALLPVTWIKPNFSTLAPLMAAMAVAKLACERFNPPLIRPLASALVVAYATSGAIENSHRQRSFSAPGEQDQARSAFAAQSWIRDNTPAGSLLMVDPALSYFGRDISQRPSFGTPREWLLISIIYDSRKDLLEEGMKRYKAMGLAAPDYIYDPAARRLAPMIHRISNDAAVRYYAMSANELTELAAKYQIKYFIFQASLLKGEPALPVVYRNNHFVVAAAR